MSKNPLISVIVPVYNVAPYLEQCVDSVISQTYENIEIILVDDGSTDGSEKICDEYLQIDHRIKVVHKINGGLSSARNAGIDLAQGDRLIFIDSDDYWANPKLLETVAELAANNDDLIIWRYQRCKENETVTLPDHAFAMKRFNLLRDYKELLQSGILFASACYLAIPHVMFSNPELRFEQGALSEDVEWFAALLARTTAITLIDVPAYVYRMRNNSISNRSGTRGVECAYKHICNLTNQYAEMNSDVLNTYLAEQTANYFIVLSRSAFDCKNIRDSEIFIPCLKHAVRTRSKVIGCVSRLVGLRLTLHLLQMLDFFQQIGQQG